ncbi:sel1 repeat family protein [Legionella geestiana]|uniref:tetratricopeptide repeat protein n=1 Tax=Legionella geestiana TaxID=45065 RepID=UPI001092D197|nr:SEL1-like repeat protein [Legionella geestiana]QDQ39295.1 sel1 repeat family protein [Legionella geestiana]
MKLLMPCVCLVAASQCVYAESGMDAWRQGNYIEAARALARQQTGSPLADYYQGQMFLYGYGQLKNNTQAMQYFTEAAQKGYLPAIELLARTSLTLDKNPEKAFQWFKKAAETGVVSAQMYCAAALLFGYGTRKNEDAARRYYIDAARAGNPLAQYTLADHFLDSRAPSNRKLGLIWLEKSLKSNFSKSQYLYGTLLEEGKLVAKDAEMAKTYYTQSAEQGYLPAFIRLGRLAEAAGQWDEAKSFYEKASANGNARAQLAMADFWMNPKNPSTNAENGFLWTLKAAENGFPAAERALAALYKNGTGVAKNDNLAAQWEAKAKKGGGARIDAAVRAARWLSNGSSDVFTAYQPGGIYTAWNNRGALKQNIYNPAPERTRPTREMLFQPKFTLVEPNDVAIGDYFDLIAPMLSARQGKEWAFPAYPIDTEVESAQRNFSYVLQHEDEDVAAESGGAPDRFAHRSNVLEEMNAKIGAMKPSEPRKAAWQKVLNRLYNRAILGESGAQFQLGQLYHYGIGVAKNRQQAIIYYQLAASQQELRAEYNLGLLYLLDPQSKADYQTGMDWLMDAAFKGNDHAQYVLAHIAEKGFTTASGEKVIPEDPERAIAMYHLAAANHYGPAEYRLAQELIQDPNSSLDARARDARTEKVRALYASAASQGIAEAILPLAFYDALSSNPERQKNAFTTAQTQARTGDSEAALLLGMMYDRGIATEANPAEALYWYQQAGTNPVSQFILGSRYSEGRGVGRDLAQGEAMLQASSNSGFPWAALNLAILRQQAGQPFLPELQKAHALGNTRAGLLLADYYLAEAQSPEHLQQAIEIYRHLAEKGDGNAQMKLGFLMESGLAGAPDRVEAEKWYAAAASQGLPMAQYLYGQFWQMGGVEDKPNLPEARHWYALAGKTLPMANVALGFVLDAMEADYQAAEKAYQQAADANDALAHFDLGVMFEEGKGRPVDYKQAQAHYEAAAAASNSSAMVRLGGMAFRGEGVARDEEAALHWYREAAKLGDADALYTLGLFSETGIGLRLDYKGALSYYEQSASRGNQKAMLALARMYQYGLGVEKNMDSALRYYRELAAFNNAHAQFELARLSFEGVSTGLLPAEARRYLETAQKHGSKAAALYQRRMDAKVQKQLSVIEPIRMPVSKRFDNESAERMYFEALNTWNRGNENLSRAMLDTIMVRHPQYAPAKRAYEQLKQKNATARVAQADKA